MYEVDLKSGLMADARQLKSPHQDERPDPSDISLLVIHGISLPPGVFGGDWIDDLFLGQLDPEAHPYFKEIEGMRVSSHLLIRRDGALTQYVPFHHRAWHAGVSCFDGRQACNDYAIGIELEGADDTQYEDAQYDTLIAVADELKKAYPRITSQRIVGHSDIAPGRKTDPGECFDWSRLGTVRTTG